MVVGLHKKFALALILCLLPVNTGVLKYISLYQCGYEHNSASAHTNKDPSHDRNNNHNSRKGTPCTRFEFLSVQTCEEIHLCESLSEKTWIPTACIPVNKFLASLLSRAPPLS
jgi:hypothetical protein